MTSRLFWISVSCGLCILVGSVGLMWWFANQGPIKEFDYDRDAQEMLKIFEQDHYWLFFGEGGTSPEFILKHKSPNQYDLRYFGKLRIKTLWEHNTFIGFTAYYLKTPDCGSILFMSVKPEFRGKRYGETLINYAFNDMKRMGASRVEIFTRTNNESALKLYKRVGFVETSYVDGGGVYLSKDL